MLLSKPGSGDSCQSERAAGAHPWRPAGGLALSHARAAARRHQCVVHARGDAHHAVLRDAMRAKQQTSTTVAAKLAHSVEHLEVVYGK